MAISSLKPSYSVIFPPPAKVFFSLWRLLLQGEVRRDILLTLQRSIEGFLIGTIFGVFTGVVMGLRPFVFDVLSPLVNTLYSLPALAMVPVLMVWLGLSNSMIVIVAAVASFVQVSMNTATGIRNVPVAVINSARSMGAGMLKLIFAIYIPLSASSIFTGVRLGIEQAWKVTIATEMLIGANGLGNILVESEALLRVDVLFATIIVIGMVGYMFERLVSFIEKRYRLNVS